MDNDKERKMHRVIMATILLVMACGVQAQSISGAPFIAVHGKASTEVVPDVFPLNITLKDTTLDTGTTQALIEGQAQRIIELAAKNSVPDRDVEVSNLSVSPSYRYDDDKDQQIFLGNTYEREIKIRFRALADLRKFIEVLPKARQVQLDTASFESSKSDELRRTLLADAVGDARKTAEVMASAVGKRVGTVHNVSNQGFNIRYVESDGYTDLDRIEVTGTRVAQAPPVVLREGTISLSQSVYIIYTLVD